MKSVIVYYSISGNTRKHAEQRATRDKIKAYEIKDKKPRNGFNIWTAGLFGAISGKAAEFLPLGVDLSLFDKIIIMSPVWASSAPPTVNGVIDALPHGSKVEVVMCSQSGKSVKDRISARILARDCEVVSYSDVTS